MNIVEENRRIFSTGIAVGGDTGGKLGVNYETIGEAVEASADVAAARNGNERASLDLSGAARASARIVRGGDAKDARYL